MSRSSRFAGRVVIVTGAAGGQGSAEARLLLAEGARVVATDIDVSSPAAERLRDELGDGGLVLAHDISSAHDWARVVEATISAWGRIDALVNNAAVWWARPLLEEQVQDTRRMLDVNLIGPLLGIQAVAPVMAAQGGGSIVNVASVAGCRGIPTMGSYVMSKWGVRGLTKTAAAELATSGIRVNCVLPGAVDTPMMSQPASTAIGRVSSPEEMAAVVLFFASTDSIGITGSDLIADGGFLAGARLATPPALPI